MEEDSPFVMDPNKLDGYPSIYDLDDTGYMDYVINNKIRDMVYGDFTDIDPNYLHGYPSFGVDVIGLDYTIVSGYRDMVYGDFTDMNSAYLNNYPSFSVDVIGLDYTITNMCREYVYGSFTDMNSAYLNNYPSFSVDVIELDYTITNMCREYVYGSFTKIDSNISEIKYPIFDNSLEYYETFGAIYDTEVTKLVIPKTVTFIADYAFYRSNNIKKVKIASECLYYEHSFPKDCKIEFYEEDE